MTDSPALAPIIAMSDQGEGLWGLGGLWIIKVSSAQTGGTFSLLEVQMPRGMGTPLHRHDEDDEISSCSRARSLCSSTEGGLTQAPAKSSTYLRVRFTRGGPNRAWRFLIIATPQHEAFYQECCTAAPSHTQPPNAGQVDLSIIVPAGRRHGVQILAPPPDY